MKRLLGNFTFEQASEICSYENSFLLETIISDKPAYYPKIEKLLKDNIRVLDYGGGTGGIYHSVKNKIKIVRWTVVDTEMMCGKCKRFEDGILEFKTKIEGDYDVIIASGVLQFVPNWRKSLIQLFGVGAELYIFARMSLGRKQKTVLQKSWLSENGLGNYKVKDRLIYYPHTIIPRREFKQMIEGINYALIKKI